MSRATGPSGPSGTTAFAARALSVIGHPALLMPAAVAGSAAANGAPPRVLQLALAASVAVAACVILYSLVQVRAGRWSHVDASVPRERSQLNLVLCMLLFGAAGLLWWSGQPRLLPLGLGLGGAMVVAAAVAAAPAQAVAAHGVRGVRRGPVVAQRRRRGRRAAARRGGVVVAPGAAAPHGY
jgi:hypothetical protein